MLLGPQDLLKLRNHINSFKFTNLEIVQIPSLFVAVIMKKSLFFVDKKLLYNLFQNLIFDCTVSVFAL